MPTWAPPWRRPAEAAMFRTAENIGRWVVGGAGEVGFGSALFAESVFWTVCGRAWRQPVRLSAVVGQMMETGIHALPIATILSATIGMMLAIQSLYTLGLFGAESFAIVGIALSVVREFAPLIIGILVAGRSGSALAARISTMTINQEVDALRVIGVAPVRRARRELPSAHQGADAEADCGERCGA